MPPGSDDAASGDIATAASGCNPLADEGDCLLPFPSDVFLVDGAGSPSGRRLELPDEGLVDHRGRPVDLFRHFEPDGFSPYPLILALFPGGVDGDGLVFHTDDVTATESGASPTVVLDAETGEPVVHFAELDPRAETPAQQALIIRPLVRLEHERRYIVAISGLLDSDGDPVPAPDGFRQIRNASPRTPELLDLAERYESQLFPALADFGLERDELQLAWDFTTGSEARLTADMLAIREALIDRFGQSPPAVTVDDVREEVDDWIALRLTGTVEVPLFATSSSPGAVLRRDDSGRVISEGSAAVPFTLIVPATAVDPERTAPARVFQFGHGVFGSQAQLDSGALHSFAAELGVVLVAVDWWGMSDEDLASIVAPLIEDPSGVTQFTDRVHQGMANFLTLAYAIRDVLPNVPELSNDGAPIYDPQTLYYYGVSQGGILGGTYLALSPLVDRGALLVGGAGMSMISTRSRAFEAMLAVAATTIPDPLDQQKFISLFTMTFDRVDPLTYAGRLLSDTLPDSPEGRRVLLQVAMGDTAVPNLASHLHARAIGAALLTPAPRPIYGLEAVSAPWDGSALVEFDYGLPEPLPGTFAVTPEQESGVHDLLPASQESRRQLDLFLRPGGLIEDVCGGACVMGN